MPAFKTRLAAAAKTAGRASTVLFSLTLALPIVAVVTLPAAAHDARPTAAKPNGWSYPFSCCSGYDCREVSTMSVREQPDGYVIAGTGEVVGYYAPVLEEHHFRLARLSL